MILLYGASGHGLVVLDILRRTYEGEISFADDSPKKKYHGIPVILGDQLAYHNILEVIITIGNNHHRKAVANRLDYPFKTAIHPGAVVSSHIKKIGKGTVIMAGVVINPDVKVGDHVIINTGATVDHECKLANFVHVSPGATLCGNIEVGEGAHIGAGAVIIPGIKIGKWVTLGAGAVLINDLPDYCTAVGNPAKIIKYGKPA